MKKNSSINENTTTRSLPPITHINLRLLQTFMLVADGLSFRAAALQTHRSQSAVSAQIKQLEEQLGITLLHRTTRSVQLTTAGSELWENAKRGLHEIGLGLQKIRESVDLQRGQVSLACSPSVASTWLPRVLSAFQNDYPQVHISLVEQQSGDIFNAVRRGDADFGVGAQGSTPVDDIVFEPILADAIVALVPRSLLASTRKTIGLKELVSMPLLLHNTGTAMRQMLDRAFQERSLRFESSYQCIQMQTLVAMANAGIGVALLPESVLDGAVPPTTQVLRLVDPVLTRQVAIITARGRAMSPVAARLIALIRELAGELATTPRTKSKRAEIDRKK